MENPKPDRWGTAVRSPFGAGPRNAGGFHPHQGPWYRYPKGSGTSWRSSARLPSGGWRRPPKPGVWGVWAKACSGPW